MSGESSSTYDIGYGKPPPEYRFRPGRSGNPTGRRRRKSAPASLTEAISHALNEPLPRKKGQGRPANRRVLMIRGLIERAARRDHAALADLVKVRQEAGPPHLPKWKKVSFTEGRKHYKNQKLDTAFFEEQDRRKAEQRRRIRNGDLPLADLIDMELRRRVPAIRGGKRVIASMLDVIATGFVNDAMTDGAAVRLLQKLMPEQKQFIRQTIIEVETPDAQEAARSQTEKFADDQAYHEAMKELRPDLYT